MWIFRIFALVALPLLSACDAGFVDFPVTPETQQAQLPADIAVVRLTETNIIAFAAPQARYRRADIPGNAGWVYTVGAGDIISVVVFDHPELTTPGGPNAGVADFRVGADGNFTYPYIGRVRAAGKSPEQIRLDIARRLAEFIPDPQVDIRLSDFNSQSIVVTGAVEAPNRQTLTSVPTRLLEAVNAAGGLTDQAAPRRITVQRGNRTYTVDLTGFLEAGYSGNNPVLINGDVVNVPRSEAEEAYIMGEVAQPDVVNLAGDSVNLTQALARQGGLRGVRADARGIFVFRTVAGTMTVYQLDISLPTGLLLGTQFVLQPDDVIYVVRSPLTRWNDTISRLLPSVAATTSLDRATTAVTN